MIELKSVTWLRRRRYDPRLVPLAVELLCQPIDVGSDTAGVGKIIRGNQCYFHRHPGV